MTADEKMECGKCSRRRWYQKGYKDAKQMDERIIKIANEYGYASQSQMLIEEMAELTQAICKADRIAYRGAITKIDVDACETIAYLAGHENIADDILDEMADVQIMLLQMQFLFGMSDEDLKERMDKKIERQLKRIETGEE